jgi:riboflavin synthase
VFTGIVESSSKLNHFATNDSKSDSSVYRISINRPKQFSDIKEGDSVCVNGVCLTVVSFDNESMRFDIGPETLKITGWKAESLINKSVNLERSMKFGDRIHGHFLSGHVDEVATIVSSVPNGEAWDITLKLSVHSKNYVWKKGSLGISGVSLTVNEFKDLMVSVCLIPETIKLTNLTEFKIGDAVNIEYDWMAKAFYNQIKNMGIDLSGAHK